MIFNIDNRNRRNLIFLLSCIEILLFAQGKHYLGIYMSPVIMTLMGLMIAFLLLFGTRPEPIIEKDQLSLKQIYGLGILWLFGVFGVFYVINKLFSHHPIDHNESDVLAQVLTASRAILDGGDAYQLVKLPSYEMFNTYLPMMWLPFTISHISGIDPRFIPFIVWVIACSYVLFDVVRNKPSIPVVPLFFGVITWLLCLIIFVHFFTYDFRVTIELLPVSYYVLLTYFLVKGKPIHSGVLLGFCLLSRFSILFFIPFLFYYFWKTVSLKSSLISSLTTSLVIIFLFVVPFMSKDVGLPLKIIQNYNAGSVGEWQTHAWQNPGDEPHQLSRGTGLAIFAKKRYEWDLNHGVKRLRQVAFTSCILFGLGMILVFYYRRKNMQPHHILLGGLKGYFTIFYALVLIPYPYLFLLPLMVNGMVLLYYNLGTSSPEVH